MFHRSNTERVDSGFGQKCNQTHDLSLISCCALYTHRPPSTIHPEHLCTTSIVYNNIALPSSKKTEHNPGGYYISCKTYLANKIRYKLNYQETGLAYKTDVGPAITHITVSYLLLLDSHVGSFSFSSLTIIYLQHCFLISSLLSDSLCHFQLFSKSCTK